MTERAKPIATPGVDPGSPSHADVQRDPWIGQAINARYQVSRRLAAGASAICTSPTTASRERR